MNKFIKLLILVVLFSVGSQVFGQDVYDTPEEYDKSIQKQEQRENQIRIQDENKRWKEDKLRLEVQRRTNEFSMMEYKKWEAMHKRFHIKNKKNIHMDMKYKYMKQKKQKRIVTLMVVGVTSFVIGYEMAKDEHRYKKHGWETKPSDNWRK